MTDEDNTKLFKDIEIMIKMFRAHMKECPTFRKKVLEQVEFNE